MCQMMRALNTEEAFGPVSIISSFSDFDEALKEVNKQPIWFASRDIH